MLLYERLINEFKKYIFKTLAGKCLLTTSWMVLHPFNTEDPAYQIPKKNFKF